ncbi:MAG: acyl-CoA mutase large subunit family protein [Bacteroidetes bacterium]|nr:acyl-CoA mutase large subunit family protein [Bacteroidota bacterium]
MSSTHHDPSEPLKRLQADFPVRPYADWKLTAEKDLKGAPFDKKLITKTPEGIDLQPLYTAENSRQAATAEENPGTGSCYRSRHASGYHGAPWAVAQEFPFALAEDIRDRVQNELSRGLSAITLGLDEATGLGIDADYARPGQVGTDGLSLSGIRSVNRALEGVDTTEVPVFVRAGFSSLPLLSLWIAAAKTRGTDVHKLSGSLEADPFEWMVRKGSLPIPADRVFDEMAETLRFTQSQSLHLKTIGISSVHYQETGASAVQELAFILATGAAYLRELTSRGLPVDTVLSSIRISTATGPHFFTEVAKYRALRLLWTQLATAFGSTVPVPPVHARTSTYYQSTLDAHTNLLRVATMAFSAIAGGVQSIHTSAYDEIAGTPSDFSRRIARNTQIILKEEAHLDQVIDPAGGSFYVETLTAELAQAAWNLFRDIERKGGMLQALTDGFPQTLVNDLHASRTSDLAKRKTIMVGVNQYCNPKEERAVIYQSDAETIHRVRSEYLQKYRVSGAQEKHIRVLELLGSISNRTASDLTAACIGAVSEGATLGELCKALRQGTGEGPKVPVLAGRRLAEAFEKLRADSFAHADRHGTPPTVFLAILGDASQFKARADFSRGFFETGGFRVVYPPAGFATPEEAVKAAAESRPGAVVICSTDETYPELVPPLAAGMKKVLPGVPVVLAGFPKDQVEAHKASGVDEFIFLGADVIQIANRLLSRISKG